MSPIRAEHDKLKLVPMANGNAWYSSVIPVGLQVCIGTSDIQACSIMHSIHCGLCKETPSEALIVPCELL